MIAPVYRVALGVLVLDQLSKAWAIQALHPAQVTPLLPGLLQLRLVFNTGAAFSLFTGNAPVLGLVSAAVAAGLVLWIQTAGPLRRWQAIGLGLLLAGALGNGLDRWRSGQVVDLFELVPVSFPVFNLADVAINLAVAALVMDALVSHGRPSR